MKRFDVNEKTDIEKYTSGLDVPAELRRLADKMKKRETVLLPMCKASDWWKCDVEVDFEPVKISRLLWFLADMIG
jgi:hypothetical protein